MHLLIVYAMLFQILFGMENSDPNQLMNRLSTTAMYDYLNVREIIRFSNTCTYFQKIFISDVKTKLPDAFLKHEETFQITLNKEMTNYPKFKEEFKKQTGLEYDITGKIKKIAHESVASKMNIKIDYKIKTVNGEHWYGASTFKEYPNFGGADNLFELAKEKLAQDKTKDHIIMDIKIQFDCNGLYHDLRLFMKDSISFVMKIQKIMPQKDFPRFTRKIIYYILTNDGGMHMRHELHGWNEYEVKTRQEIEEYVDVKENEKIIELSIMHALVQARDGQLTVKQTGKCRGRPHHHSCPVPSEEQLNHQSAINELQKFRMIATNSANLSVLTEEGRVLGVGQEVNYDAIRILENVTLIHVAQCEGTFALTNEGKLIQITSGGHQYDHINDVKMIFSSAECMVVLKNNGDALTLAHFTVPENIKNRLKNIIMIVSTKHDFAALTSDNTVVIWGDGLWSKHKNREEVKQLMISTIKNHFLAEIQVEYLTFIQQEPINF